MPPRAPAVAPVVVPRWVQIVLLPIALLALWALARAAGTVLLVLIVASLVALILAPSVRLLERYIPRGLAILLVYLGGFAVLAGDRGPARQSRCHPDQSHFQHNLPEITRNANRDLANVQTFLDQHGINVHIQKQGQSALDTLQKNIAQALRRHRLVLA